MIAMAIPPAEKKKAGMSLELIDEAWLRGARTQESGDNKRKEVVEHVAP